MHNKQLKCIKYGQNDNDKKNRNEKSVTKTKTLSKFFPRLLRFYYVLFYLVCSVLLIFGLVDDTGVSSVMSIN